MITFHAVVLMTSFIFFGCILNCILAYIISKKRSNRRYKSLLIFVASVLLYGLCMLMLYHKDHFPDVDIALGVIIASNVFFVLLFITWGIYLCTCAGKKSLDKFDRFAIGFGCFCVIFWIIDSLFFINTSGRILIFSGELIGTSAEVVFGIILGIWYFRNIFAEKGYFKYAATAVNLAYFLYVIIIDFMVLNGKPYHVDSGEMDIHSYILYCDAVALLCLIFLLRRLYHEMTYNDDGIQYLSEEELTLRFGITAREMEVIKLIYKNCNNDEIAAEMFITVNTVKKHINSIFKKMSVTSRVDLINTFKLTNDSK